MAGGQEVWDQEARDREVWDQAPGVLDMEVVVQYRHIMVWEWDTDLITEDTMAVA